MHRPTPSPSSCSTDCAAPRCSPLPYLPVAVRSLQETDLIGLIPTLLQRGTTVLTDRLSARLRSGVWDPAAAMREADAQLLADLGYRSLLVPSSAS